MPQQQNAAKTPAKTTVHNIKREQMQPGDIYIGRSRANEPPSRWGNPYRVTAGQSRTDVIRQYRELLERKLASGELTEQDFAELRGKRLFCFCKPADCHGDVLAEYANRNRRTSWQEATETTPTPNRDLPRRLRPVIGRN